MDRLENLIEAMQKTNYCVPASSLFMKFQIISVNQGIVKAIEEFSSVAKVSVFIREIIHNFGVIANSQKLIEIKDSSNISVTCVVSSF